MSGNSFVSRDAKLFVMKPAAETDGFCNLAAAPECWASKDESIAFLSLSLFIIEKSSLILSLIRQSDWRPPVELQEPSTATLEGDNYMFAGPWTS